MNFPDPKLPAILIADDSQDDAFLVRYRLRLAEVPNIVLTFEDTALALRHMRALDVVGAPPHLVFVDIKMPGGLELITGIRDLAAFDDTKVVVMTYSNDPADLTHAIELGVDGYLIKFPDADSLGEFVRHGPWFDLRPRTRAAAPMRPAILCA